MLCVVHVKLFVVRCMLFAMCFSSCLWCAGLFSMDYVVIGGGGLLFVVSVCF